MKKKLLVFLGLMLVLSMFLAACSGGEAEPGDDPQSETPEGDDEGTTNEGSDVAQHLRVNIKTEPFSLHPGLANDTTSSSVLAQTFEGLTRIGKNGEPEPAMAEKIDVNEDSTVYTFHLRDAKWSNGDPVTAEDFAYAWKWALDPANESQYAYQLYYIKNAAAANDPESGVTVDEVGIKVVDEKTLEVTLENPTPYFLELTAFYTYYPVHKATAEANPEWHTNAGDQYISNGPFVMTNWDHGNQITLEKNANYWDAGTVKLEKIDMYMINEDATELSMYQNGELDWAGDPFGSVPVDAIPSLKDQGILNVQPITGVYWYKFNTEAEPFNNVNIRKAFTYAINRKAIVENITLGGQVPAMAIVPPTMFPENEEGYFEDNAVDLAKEHLQKGLEELGYSDVSELPEITLSYNTDDTHAKIAQAVQQMWKEALGIEVGLENTEWQVYIDQLHSGDYQIGRMGWLGDFNDPINFLELFRDKEGGNNDTNWEDPNFKQLLLDSATEKDPAAREAMLKQAEEIFMEQLPVAPIYFYTNVWLQKENLKDVVVSGLGDVQLKWAYFE
ncbi:MAG TPA: peptide ABC transporter substrate-binding protein [Bacillus sp. (in: firmicutes)]|uniref:peptide ABC transporter substrate-binding protein n=1 Tax=Bacillus litorisediminis TaxID=2922713 RepID=UPI0028BD606A|nr:peptide ABC transporter substrate-binding protein [Bacillus litorisediminis]HWO78171.1 peptide ABC transporter substrate-binding protein [Bacillus sp. (in: firmicutes)]